MSEIVGEIRKTEEVQGDDNRFILYLVECTQCHDQIEIAEESFSPSRCRCGFVWSVEVRAVGRKVMAYDPLG